jgi:hypothetical protein
MGCSHLGHQACADGEGYLLSAMPHPVPPFRRVQRACHRHRQMVQVEAELQAASRVDQVHGHAAIEMVSFFHITRVGHLIDC